MNKQQMLADIMRRKREILEDLEQRKARREAGEEILHSEPVMTMAEENTAHALTDNEQATLLRQVGNMIVARFKEYESDIAGPAHDELIADLERELDNVHAEIEALKTEIGALRADVSVLQGIQRGTVAELKTRGSSDAA
jgi:hypothetical protein